MKKTRYKICGYCLMGIISISNFPISKDCIKYIHYSPHAQIEYQEPVQQITIFDALNGTISSSTTDVSLDLSIYNNEQKYGK